MDAALSFADGVRPVVLGLVLRDSVTSGLFFRGEPDGSELVLSITSIGRATDRSIGNC